LFSSLYQKVAFLSTLSPYLNGIGPCGRLSGVLWWNLDIYIRKR
jgi:hypothetical protein